MNHTIKSVMARLVFAVSYFTFLAPFGVLLRWTSDPLRLKQSPGNSFWISPNTKDRTLEDARAQY